MKLTNATIYDIIGAVNKFNNAKVKTAFILFRTLRKLNEEIKDCDEQKNKLIQKYGKEVEGGGIAIPRDDAEATKNFMEEFTPILLCPIDVDIPQLTEEEFNDLENVDAPNAGLTDFDIIYTFLVKKPESKKEETEKVDAEVVDDKAAE